MAFAVWFGATAAAAWWTFLALTARDLRSRLFRGIVAAWLVLVASLWGYQFRKGSSTPVTSCDTIHIPPTGCPPGAERLPGFFSEADGSRRDACRLPAGEPCIDELRPGEGFAVELDLRAPTPEGVRL